MNRYHLHSRYQKVGYLILAAVLMFSCVLPGFPTSAPQPTPTAYQEPLPPALVEVTPPDGSQISLEEPITFYFNQPMDRDSVEAALFGLPAGALAWDGDSVLTFTPNQPYNPGEEVTVAILTSAKAANGLPLLEPLALGFPTTPSLKALNVLPGPDSQDIDPASAVAVAFNQPVVPLGQTEELPEAFALDPAVNGRGEWLSTSTYIFYPEPALSGGETYTALLNTDLVSVAQAPLDTTSSFTSWSFQTALPRLVSVEPANDKPIGLDAAFTLVFNQAMDPASIEDGVALRTGGMPIQGTFAWNDDYTEVTFQPDERLERNTPYTLTVSQETMAVSGTSLETEAEYRYSTYGDFAVSGSEPVQGGVKAENANVRVFFTSPVQNTDDLEQVISVTPEIPGFRISLNGTAMNLIGFYEPETRYRLHISADLVDRWGQRLEVPYNLDFRTPPAAPKLDFPYSGSWDTLFVRPEESVLYVSAINIQRVDVTVAPISLDDFQLLDGPGGYDARKSYKPVNPRSYSQSYRLPASRSETVTLPLAASDRQLEPGLYYVQVASPQLSEGVGASGEASDQNADFHLGGGQATQVLVVSSFVSLTFKAGATDALLWAMDLRTNEPVTNTPLVIYDYKGRIITTGVTDEQGLWQAEFSPTEDVYHAATLAVLGEPGEETFGLAFSSWSTGISPWEFGLSYSQRAPQPEIYLYTDRPIYRPGQTVHFRGVVRQAFNARYTLPDLTSFTLQLQDPDGYNLQTFELPLSDYGTVHGDIRLSPETRPGSYRLFNQDLGTLIYFEVAEYRKPEFELELAFDQDQLAVGEQLQAEAAAQYYFGSPASDLDVQWSLYDYSSYFYLPGYQTGVFDDSWLRPYWDRGHPFGRNLDQGSVKTDPQGHLDLELPEAPESDMPQRLTLELTAQDESGFPVSARAEVLVHPAEFYIGVRPDQWVGQAGKPIGFEILTADWEKEASPSRKLQAEFKQVRWERVDSPAGLPYDNTSYEPVYSAAASSSLSTGADGKARLSFTPEEPGTYILEVSGQGARTQALLWVGGTGTATWPRLLNDQVHLTADQETYQPGETANIFIPNPFEAPVRALVTVERGKVMRAEVLTLGATGTTYPLPLTAEYAPNVFFSVTLLGEQNQFRQGYLDIEVDPGAQELQVVLTAEPEVNRPRGEMTLELQVSDHEGKPVEGEFSLSVVDKAVLALADPNSTDIMSAFYGEQPLGVDTGLSLAVYSGRYVPLPPGGRGGGGGGEMSFVREQFPDTAYWNPTFVTDANGQAEVTITLPDNLTTWLIETRGLTLDTRVGQAESEVVTTKPLLIRPVTPRFMVSGDHIELAAIVHNNSDVNLKATVNLNAKGFTLDQPEETSQAITVSAGERARVSWWGVAGEAPEADLTFSVSGSGGGNTYQDAAKPVLSPIPIRAYTAPQAFVTAGMLSEAGSRLEVVSLPRTLTPHGGGLEVEMTASLAATMLDSLEALPVPSCTCNNEAVLSYLLPNLATYQATQASGIEVPELQGRLEGDLVDSTAALVRNQNADGGWGWIRGGASDGYLSAYVLFGLARAREAGASVPERVLESAQEYVREQVFGDHSIERLAPWELDRLAFTVYALQSSGGLLADDQPILEGLHDGRDRLDPWAKALLALSLEAASPGDPRARDLIANLETSAVRTASSTNWESESASWRVPGTPLYTTAVVVYALAQRDPAAPELLEAVRYLASNRNASGMWGSTYESAWVILALTEAMQGLGELQADFTFSAEVNGAPLASGEASGTKILDPIRASVPLQNLSADHPNALTFQRDQGLGRLYYRAALLLDQPVESIRPLSHGLQVSRAYYDGNCTADCTPLTALALAPESRLVARLTLTLPNDAYYVTLDDSIPAGTELLNRVLKTSQQGEDATQVQIVYDEQDPYARGWGWWYFNEPQFHDDRITWTADFLPAGTYELTYTLIPTTAGEFRVIPAHAWLAFFPDVQGTSAGAVFEIEP